MIHVVPNDGLHETEGTGCWCRPRIENADPDTGQAYAEMLVIHNGLPQNIKRIHVLHGTGKSLMGGVLQRVADFL